MNLNNIANACYSASAFFQGQADLNASMLGGSLMQQSQGLLQSFAPALTSLLSQFQGAGGMGGMGGMLPDKWGMAGACANGFVQAFGGRLPMCGGSPLSMPGQQPMMPMPMPMPMLPTMPGQQPMMPMPMPMPMQGQRQMPMNGLPSFEGSNAGPLNFDTAMHALAREFDGVKDASGHVTMARLQQIAAQGPGNGISPSAFMAATHFVNNPHQFSALENAFANSNPGRPGNVWNDGKASNTDFMAAGTIPGSMTAPGSMTMPAPNTAGSGTTMDYDKAVKTLANEFDKVKNGDGHVTMDRLKDIVRQGVGPNVSPEMHKAAEYFVNNRGDFHKLETSNQSANAGMPIIGDGKVSLKDIHQEMPKLKAGEGDAKVWNDLFSNQGGLFNGDRLCNKGEIQKLADTGILPDGCKASPEQQQAAKIFMSRPDMQVLLDSAAHSRGAGDNTYSKKDVELVLKKAMGERIR